MKHHRALLVLAIVLVGCGDGSHQPDAAFPAGGRSVYTTFHPTTWMAEVITGGTIPVVCPLPPGEDPILWRPDAAAIAAYQKAGLIVVNGAELEKWVPTASLPKSRVVDLAAAITEPLIRFQDPTSHSHGGGVEHRHEGIDGHTWLDPLNAKVQARALRDALIARFPESEPQLRKGLSEVEKELDLLHARLEKLSPRLKSMTLLCSHPAYNYLARRYGWTVRNFDLDPAATLRDGDLWKLKNALTEGQGALLLWESPPLPATIDRLKEKNITSVVFSPCESLSADDAAQGATYATLMNANLDRLEATL